MPIVLYRVDERLIHGQVVVGWGTRLHPDLIVVVDDDLAQSPWEQELYCLGLPPHLKTKFDDVAQARACVPAWRTATERVMVLTRDVRTMRRLGADGLLKGEEINLGGIHHAAGRTAVLPYLYLSEEERQEMAALSADGAIVSARDLPGGRKVDLSHLMR
jgi:PTS system mannose-specific IIB component/fructoselysine and glucoselysine-specific PTS system IIB component